MTPASLAAAAAGLAAVSYVMWDARSGRIVSVGVCHPNAVEAQRREPYHALLVSQDMATFRGVSSETHFVENGELKERPPVPDIRQSKTDIMPNGVDVVTWTGVPKGAAFQVRTSVLGTVDDGVIEWTTDEHGEFDVTIEAWPAQAWRGTVRAF